MATQATLGVIKDASITSAKVQDGSITAAKLAPDAAGGDIVDKVTSSLAYSTVVGDLTFSAIGNPLAITGSAYGGDITALSATQICVADGGNDTIRTYSWDGTDFSLVGNSFSHAMGTELSVAALTATTIAVHDGANDELTKYTFDGTDWSQTGNSLTISGADFNCMAGMSANRVAFIDSANKDLRAYDFDGTNWSQTGNDLNITTAAYFDMSAMSSSTIALVDGGAKNITKYSFDGTNWTKTGNSSSTIVFSGGACCSSGADNEVFIGGRSEREVEKWAFDGTNWAKIGSSFTNPALTNVNPGMAALNATTVVYITGGSASVVSKLRVYEFDVANYAITDASSTGELGVVFDVGSTAVITDTASNNGSHLVTKIVNANVIQVATALTTETANTSTATRTKVAKDIIEYHSAIWVPRSTPIGFTHGTTTAATSGTSVDLTGIANNAKLVVLNFFNVSMSTDSNFLINLGTDIGIHLTDYQSSSANLKSGSVAGFAGAINDGFVMKSHIAGDSHQGSMMFHLADVATNTWSCTHQTHMGGASGITVGSGLMRSLPGPLTQLRVTTESGTANFDNNSGLLSVMWQ